MSQLLLQIVPIATNTYNTYCTFAGSGVNSLNAANWIYITGLVLAINFALAGVLYALSGILPTSYREKLKGAVKYEAFQGIISCIILAILIVCASGLCNVGQALVYTSTPQAYQNPLQFSTYYVNSLMFTTGLNLFNEIYAESVALTLTGNIADSLEQFLPEASSVNDIVGFSISAGLLGIFFGFSGALTSTFLGLISISFGVLFIVSLIIPYIQQLAFTVLLPIALIIRSIPFAGPNLRQTSDTFLALAVAFYFILPLTLLLNNFIMSWIYTPCPTAIGVYQPLCNPYSEYTGNDQLLSISPDTLFSTPPTTLAGGNGFLGGLAVPSTFYSGSSTGLGGFGGEITSMISALFILPVKIIGYGQATAQFLFQGIFLIGLDLAITIAFAMGLSKGLSSVGSMLGVGPFWGGY